MTKYLIIANGSSAKARNMTGNEMKEAMGKWMKDNKDTLVDMGAPMMGGVSVLDNGTEGEVTGLSGYSMVQAENIEEAKEVALSHPMISEGNGDGSFKIEVHELMDTPKM